MAYDLSALDRVQQRFVRRGTSLFIETYNMDTNSILDSFEFTNAPQSVPSEVYEVAQRRLLDLVSPVSAPWILAGATAGQGSGWIPYVAGMRLAYALDSGTTSTGFSVDISADGSTSLGQAFTGTYASSTAYETTPPIWLSNQAARFIRFNVLSGGPLSVRSNV